MSETTLGELAQSGALLLGDGYRTRRSELTDRGFRIIRVADVRNGGISLDSPDFVSADFERQIGAKRAVEGDVLLTTKGTVGRVAIVPELAGLAVYSPQLCWFRVNESNVINSRFLAYWLQSDAFLSQSSYMQGNTDMAPYISLSDLRSSSITLPSLSTQQAIAEVLGALDDKIAANTLVATTLIATAQALVASVETELVALDDVAEFYNRRRVPLSANERADRPGDVPYYGANGQMSTVDEAIFNESLALMGEDGSVVRGDGTPYVAYVWGPSWVNNHAHVLVGKGISTELLALALETARVDTLVTGAVQPKLSMGNAKRIQLRIPVSSRLASVDERVRASYELLRAVTDEDRALAATRDALLPQLMSGKLRVRDAEAAVAKAGA